MAGSDLTVQFGTRRHLGTSLSRKSLRRDRVFAQTVVALASFIAGMPWRYWKCAESTSFSEIFWAQVGKSCS
jgi:hypothetical protein